MRLTDDMIRVVNEQRLGFVATVCPDGTPSLSPKGTTAALDDEHLVFLDIHSPGTVSNLTTNPVTEINVVDPIRRRGYRFKGRARLVPPGPELTRILGFYDRTRGPGGDYDIRHAVVVAVEEAAELVSPVYGTGAEEDEVVTRWLAHHAALAGGSPTDPMTPTGRL
jgi:predicted pyridoxine 5'-phosphate oxidase superfamily flavin-nucleotide-binding protein